MSISEDPIQSTGQLKNKSTLKTTFNPVKEVKGDQRSQAIQWTSAILDVAVKGLGKGKRLVANPFYENNVKLLKPDLVFVRTAQEVAEWERCANDIFYFVETYAKTMTPLGIRNITLRDYQRRYLQLLLDNQLTIYRAARQSSKCAFFISKVLINISTKDCLLAKKINLSDYFINEDTYEIPFYEIWNCYDTSFKWKIKYRLYKIIDKLYAKQKRSKVGQKPGR